MGFFDRNKKEDSEITEDILNNNGKKQILERPRICCIDLNDDVTENLINSNYNIYKGTLGKKIKIPERSRSQNYPILLNYDFPTNLHEYDVVIIDLDNFSTIEYNVEDHTRKTVTGKSYISLISNFPETIFDPRPLSSSILKSKINSITNRSFLIICFSTSQYDIEYETMKIYNDWNERQKVESYNIYSFLTYVPFLSVKVGTEIEILEVREDLGLINFRPTNLIFIDEPKEFFHSGLVCIINIENTEIKVGDIIYIEKNDCLNLVEVKGLMINDNPLQRVDNGEVGIKFDKKIKKNSKLWIRKNY